MIDPFTYRRYNGGMQTAYLFLFCSVTLLAGDALLNALSKGKVKNAGGSISRVEQQVDSEQLKQTQEIGDLKEKQIKGITVNVAEVNLTGSTSINVEYSPKYQNTIEGTAIDNQEQTTVNFNYRF